MIMQLDTNYLPAINLLSVLDKQQTECSRHYVYSSILIPHTKLYSNKEPWPDTDAAL